MLQLVEQTKEEKMSMYMKLSKKQLAEMLINCNDIITTLTQEKNCVTPKEVEKEYEILSFENTSNKNVDWKKTGDNEYTHSSGELCDLEGLLYSNHWKIHSVKRKSDGEVFTIGDKVNSTISDLGGFTDLTGFILDNNKISLGLKIGLRGIGYYPLNTIIKYKKPIEKDYEILSLTSIESSTKKEKVVWYFDKENNGWTVDEPERAYYKDIPDFTSIHSIKRLSDGEVFTVGDKVKEGIIANIIIKRDKIYLEI